jgi:hypothetical protein
VLWHPEPGVGQPGKCLDITSTARPWLGTVSLSDDGVLDWRCDWRAAFHDNPASLVDMITPILRAPGPAPREQPQYAGVAAALHLSDRYFP